MFVTMWSVQPLSTSMPAILHCMLTSTSMPATDSCLTPSLCLLHALSRWPFSPHLLHCVVSFLLQFLAKCPVIPHTKRFPFMGPFLKSGFTASATEPHGPFYLCAVLSWKFCSLFLNSVKFDAGLKSSCITKLSYLIGRPLKTIALKRVSETASPASCSLVSNSCPVLKNLSKTSKSSSYSRESCTTKVTTVGVSTLWNVSCKDFKPMLHLRCRHLPNSHVSSAWGLLLLDWVPDGTTHCPHTLTCIFQHIVVLLLIIARPIG